MNVRFLAQEACLVGNLKDYLPQEAVVAHIEVPAAILRNVYLKDGFREVSDVFPPRSEDPILGTFLSLPWVRLPIDSPIPAYVRSLELPEYDAQFRKHLDPSTPLYEEYWVCEDREVPEDSPLRKLPTYKMSEMAYYANTNKPFDLSAISAVVAEYGGLVVELDNVVLIPENRRDGEFEKGILVEKLDDKTVMVGGLVIDYLGHRVKGLAVTKGWAYDISGPNWKKINHSDTCPCNNDLRHQLQYAVLGNLNEALDGGELIQESDLVYSHKDLRPQGVA